LFIASTSKDGENIKISNRQYQHENGHHERKTKLKKYTKNVDKIIEEDRSTYELPIQRQGNSLFREFINFELKWMVCKQQMYCQFRVARLNR
jgi:hypothetical protein